MLRTASRSILYNGEKQTPIIIANGVAANGGQSLECGDASPLSMPSIAFMDGRNHGSQSDDASSHSKDLPDLEMSTRLRKKLLLADLDSWN
jgi:hypothetical protein